MTGPGALPKTLIAILVVFAAVPAAAQAQLTWTPPGTLSIGEQNADLPDLAVNAQGTAIAAWRRFDAERWNIEVAVRSPGGTFGPPRVVQRVRLGADVRAPKVAIDPRGNAVVAWHHRIPSPPGNPPVFEVRAAPIAAGGAPGPVQDIGVERVDSPVQVAMDAQGNALAVWRGSADGSANRVQAAFRPAGGQFAPEVAISPGETSIDPSLHAAFDSRGNALVAWGGRDPFRVQTAFRPAGGSFAAPQTASEVGRTSFNPRVSFDAAGNATVVFHAFADSGAYIVQSALRLANGSFGAPRTISGESAFWNLDSPQVAVAPLGDAISAWGHYAGPNWNVQTAFRAAGGNFAAATPVDTGNVELPYPRVAIDGQGRAAAVWIKDDGDTASVQASDRSPGAAGAFSTPEPISEPGDFSYTAELGMDNAGTAVAVWSRSDGANLRIQAAFGVRPGQPGPPAPPPPPEPLTPNVIQPAEPFRRSRAVVLTANIAGPIDRLEWDLPGAHPEVVGTVVDGALQKSVRFRPSPGDKFTVKVRAVGPGGSPSFSRTFTAPKGLAGADVNRVRNALGSGNAPRVFAVGHANALLGKAQGACGPMTILSGDLKLSGCFSPVEALADIPDAERGVLDAVSRELNIEGARTELMRTAVELTDGYVARGQLAMNGVWPVIPRGNAAIAAFPQAKALASSDAALKVAGQLIDPRGGFMLKIDPRAGEIRLGPIPRPPSLPSIGGFKLVGDFDVDLERQEAKIRASLKLPSFLKKAGVDIQSEVRLRATPDRLIIDEITIGPIGVHVGALAVDDFRVVYRRVEDTWQGQGKACVVKGICLDMVPPNGQIKIKNGRLDFAGASLHFPPPGLPLFTGVNMERIGFGFGLEPTRFTGNARLAFSHILVIDGRLVIAFPTPQTPFFLRRDEVGNDFPAHLYNYRYTGTTVGISAGASLRLPAVGEIPFANAYALYEYPGYMALGGGVNYAFREPLTKVALVSVDGRVDGEFNAGNGRFNIDGRVHACVVDVLCRGVDGNVSSNGMSVCTAVDTFLHEFHMGGAIRWSPFKFIPYLDGCAWGRFREANVRGARIAQAGGPYVVRVKRDDPSKMIMLNGEAGSPLVRVRGPGGRVLESPAGAALTASPDAKIRIMRSESAKFVAVGLAGAAPGTYTIEQMAGSAAVTRIQESTALPNARVSGEVSGRGKRRVLSYRVGRRPNQTVTFVELGAGGTGKEIGRIKTAGRGKLRFSPAPGRGVRRIEARFELDGVPAEQKLIARFKPPSPRLAKPARLGVRRKGKGLRVSWRRVRGATRYELSVTSSTGRQRYSTTSKTKAILRRIPKSARGRVSVRAVDGLRQSVPAFKRFRRTARRTLNLRPLPRCRVKRKVVCRGPGSPTKRPTGPRPRRRPGR